MKAVANKQKICDVLMEAAKTDKDIVFVVIPEGVALLHHLRLHIQSSL